MRIPESKIKEALLHEEEEIRLRATVYFAVPGQTDESILPLIIQAIEKYGRDTSFSLLRQAEELPQTEDTVKWLTAELSEEVDLDDVRIDNLYFSAALMLCNAPVELLSAEMVDLPGFPEELREEFLERLEMATWDWDRCWSELEEYEDGIDDFYFPSEYAVYRRGRLVEALARYPEHADDIFRMFREFDEQYEDGTEAYWFSIIELVGRMKIEEAVPRLIALLGETETEWEQYDEDVLQTALQTIGGDIVVREIARHWPDASDHLRTSFASVLEDIRTDLAAEKCMEFLVSEKRRDIRESLIEAALDNLVPEAIEPIRQILLDGQSFSGFFGVILRYHLVSAATIMQAKFPEYEQWYTKAATDCWGCADLDEERIRDEYLLTDDDQHEDWEDEWDDDEDDGWYRAHFAEAAHETSRRLARQIGLESMLGYDRDDESAEEQSDEEPLAIIPIRRDEEKVGRNAPCPCGSGKKYKKCCMRKQGAGD